MVKIPNPLAAGPIPAGGIPEITEGVTVCAVIPFSVFCGSPGISKSGKKPETIPCTEKDCPEAFWEMNIFFNVKTDNCIYGFFPVCGNMKKIS